MKVSASVTIDGQTTRLETRPVDIVRWEKGTKQKITAGLGATDLMQLIHSAARRQQLTEAAFEDWVASLEDFEVETNAAGPTSTPPGA